jgi:hypothetical protein
VRVDPDFTNARITYARAAKFLSAAVEPRGVDDRRAGNRRQPVWRQVLAAALARARGPTEPGLKPQVALARFAEAEGYGKWHAETVIRVQRRLASLEEDA